MLGVWPVPVIGVCGPVGAGKSTLTARLAEELGFAAWPERVADNPFFDRYTRDKSTWAYLSQLAFMLGAVQDAAAARRVPPGAVLERPVEEMLNIFVRTLHRRGLLDGEELAKLERVAELGCALAGVPEVLILLHGDPELLLERIQDRARGGEEMYDLPELGEIQAAYSDWRVTLANRIVIDVDAGERDLRDPLEIGKLGGEVRAALELRSSGP